MLTAFLFLWQSHTFYFPPGEPLPNRAIIPIFYMRASSALKAIESLGVPASSLKANDKGSFLEVNGDPEIVDRSLFYAGYVDVVARPISIKATIESKSQGIFREESIDLLAGQPSTMSDPRLGVSVTIRLRMNDDNTITYLLDFRTKEFKHSELALRVKVARTEEFTILKDGAYLKVDEPRVIYSRRGALGPPDLPWHYSPYRESSTSNPSDLVFRITVTKCQSVR